MKSGIAVICDPDNSKNSAMKIEQLINGEMNLIPNLDYLEKFKWGIC